MIKKSKYIAIFLIHFYQRFAPKFIRSQCRYNPSCSEYAIMVIEHYGLFAGVFLSLFRILRCIPPFHGYDPPPFLKGNLNGSRKMS